MPNIATLLKSEITRLARKEVRAEVARLQKASSAYRSEIAALKRRLADLERVVARASKGTSRAAAAAPAAAGADGEDAGAKGRFSAKSMRSQRKRLGLSAAEVGLLVGSSAQSVYNWEEGKIRPQARHLHAIFALRGMGRREAQAKLAALAGAPDA
jgi:DNA-binding transcriptional regulator YiaG